MTVSHSLHRLFTPDERAQLYHRDAKYWARFARGRSIGYRRGLRGGTWYARVRLLNKTNKEKRLAVADDDLPADGKTVLSFPQALAAAERWCSSYDDAAIPRNRDWESKRILPELPPSPPYTVAHAVVEYLEWARENTVTFDRRYYQARAHIIPKLGDIPVNELRPVALRKWLTELAETPPRVHTGRAQEQQYDVKRMDAEYFRKRKRTANSIYSGLRAALNRAFNRGLIEDDGAWARVRGFRGVDRRPARFLEKAEIEELIKACRPDFARLAAGALMTGCRVTELRRMQVQDFSEENGRVKVQDAKSKEQRYVSLSNEGIDFFRTLTRDRQPNEHVFLSRNGLGWRRGGYWRLLQEACAKANIRPPIRFHDLRHAYASQAVRSGVPLKVVSQQLGHVDTRMVDRNYGRVGSVYIDEVIQDRMPDLLPDDMPSRLR